MKTIKMQWREYNLNLSVIDKKLRETYPSYLGNSADTSLRMHFSSLTEAEELSLNTYLDGINEASEEAVYVSKENEQALINLKKQSAKEKLMSLGLTEDEIKALIGG